MRHVCTFHHKKYTHQRSDFISKMVLYGLKWKDVIWISVFSALLTLHIPYLGISGRLVDWSDLSVPKFILQTYVYVYVYVHIGASTLCVEISTSHASYM